jgi:hypothetical protein
MHKELNAKFRDVLKSRIATANLNRRVIDGEPRLEDYFERLNPFPDNPGLNSDTQYEPRGIVNGVKARADLAVQLTDLNKSLIIDFTFVEPTARAFIGLYNKAGQAALKGRDAKLSREYKDWTVEGDNVTNIFKIIAFETFGATVPEDLFSIFSLFINDKENRPEVMHLVMQQLSVAIHTIRASVLTRMESNGIAFRSQPLGNQLFTGNRRSNRNNNQVEFV